MGVDFQYITSHKYNKKVRKYNNLSTAKQPLILCLNRVLARNHNWFSSAGMSAKRFKPFFIRWLQRRFDRWKEPLDSPRSIGDFGEARAEEFLRREKGYRIVSRNWQRGRGEIDLVAWDKEVLVFVEVRTRHARNFVPGFFSVTGKKKKALLPVCQAYIRHLKNSPRHFRFDIVEIRYYTAINFTVNHYANVRLFSKNFRPQHPIHE